MPTVAERLAASLRELTQPLMNELHEVELEISVREEELKELRSARTKLLTIARQVDPELAPKKEKPKPEPQALISDEAVEMMYGWLRENYNGDEFYASGISRRADSPGSHSTISKSLVVLHERGQLRLIRQGSGGSKHYRLVA